MNVFFKKVLPIMLALCMTVGSCITVFAADSDRFCSIDNPTAAQLYSEINAQKIWNYFGESITTSSISDVSDIKYIAVIEYGSWFFCAFSPSEFYINSSGQLACKDAVQFSYLTYYPETVASSEKILVYNHNNYLGIASAGDFVANQDIYYSDGTIFFKQTPVVTPVTPLEGTTLTEIVQGIKPETVTSEIVAMIPIVMIVLVGYLALRKGLRFILTILRQA